MTDYEIYLAAGIEIVERDGDTMHMSVTTVAGVVTVMAEMLRVEGLLVLDQVHVDGQGLRLGDIRRLAKVFGEVEDVEEVIIQGGTRTSGAHPGSRPTPIRVQVTR